MPPLDAHSVDERLAATEPTRRETYILYVLVMAIIAAMMILPAYGEDLGLPSAVGVLLLLLMIFLLLGIGWMASRRHKACREDVIRAWEHVRLEEWGAAGQVLDRVMQRPIRSVADRAEAFLLLGAVAEHEGYHDGAAQIYEALALRQIGAPSQLHQARIALAAVKIHNQELTDAIDLLARLEQVPMPDGLRAGLDLVRLFQQVFMGQSADAVQDLPRRREFFRRQLSTQAGYGYALLATALHHLDRREEAAKLWADATALIAPGKLVKEYSCVTPVAKSYPATERPL